MTSAELRLMDNILARERGFQQRMARAPLKVFLMLFCFFATACLAATFLDRKPTWYVSIAIAFAVSGLVWLVSYPSLRRDRRKSLLRFHDYDAAIAHNEIHVTHIQSHSMVEFEEEEDEGACYAFQLDGRRIVIVCGQDYYPSAKFPNSDFSLIEIRAVDGTPLEGWIEKRGKKLTPVRKISAKTKRNLALPSHLEVMAGHLDRLEELLAIRTT